MPLVMESEPEHTRDHLSEHASVRESLVAERADSRPDTPDDGTRQLLVSGSWTLAVGLLAALLTETVFGGIGRQGPHTNSGWLALLVALMSLPFGFLLFLLGAAKWLRNQSLRRARNRPR